MARNTAGSSRPRASNAADVARRAAQPAEQRPARGDAGMAFVQPSRPGAVAGDHRQKRGQVLAVMVLDQRFGTLLEGPAGAMHAPAEVDVAGRADPLLEAAQPIESRLADEQVAGRRGDPRGAVQALGLIEEVAIARVAGQEAALLADPADRAGHRAAAIGDRGGEVAVKQVGDGNAIGVDEQQPVGLRRRGSGVAGVIGGALARRGDDRGHVRERRGRDPGLGVVGDDQLVVNPALEASERRTGARSIGAVTAKRDHHADRRPAGAGGAQSVGVTR